MNLLSVVYVNYIKRNYRRHLIDKYPEADSSDFSVYGLLKLNFRQKIKQGNRGDMRKIHMTWQFSKASGPHGHFFEKTKITRFY